MKILEMDEEKKRWITIRIDNVDDLYTLYNFIRPGDIVTKKTRRKVQTESYTQRKPMILSIVVERVSFAEFEEELRISGRIIEGPEQYIQLGAHHTFRVKIGSILTITREEGFTDEDLEILEEAEKLSAIPPIILCAIEDGEATVGLLTLRGLRIVGTVTRNINVKGISRDKKALLGLFFADVYKLIEKLKQEYNTNFLIVAGPGFTKDDFIAFIRERDKDFRIYSDSVTSGTVSGLHEILRRRLPERILQDQRISLETAKVDEILAHIGKNDGLAVLGIDNVKRAVELGIVQELLVSMGLINTTDKKLRDTIIDLIRKTKQFGGKVMFISDAHPAGEQFKDALGGIAAILRFRLDYVFEAEKE